MRFGDLLRVPPGVLVALTWASAVAASPPTAELAAPTFSGSPLVTPAAAFVADGFDPATHFFSFGGFVRGTTGSQGYGCLVAPAYLPSGATVTHLLATVYDNDPGRPVTIELRRVDNFSGTTSTMASASTSGASTAVVTISDSTIANPLVDYPSFSYYFTTCLGSDLLRLYSAHLYYARVIFVDGFESGNTLAWSFTQP